MSLTLQLVCYMHHMILGQKEDIIVSYCHRLLNKCLPSRLCWASRASLAS